MDYNQEVLNRSLDNYLMKGYLEEYPASEPAPTAFEDAERQISSYIQDYIADNDELPDLDEVFDLFNLRSDADYEQLEAYYKRERSLTEWDTKTPLMK